MTNLINLGESPGATIALDLERLIETRLLVQAMSGGGKSWAIRRLCEQSYGQVQQIVLDLEGEFPTLRERFPDYVIASKGGDAVCAPSRARQLARTVNRLGVSLIADMSELEAHDRVRFVRLFLEELVNLPRADWRPALVIIDEAQHFVPEKGSAESARAVIDLSTRGRKRGLCPVLATSRLAKIHKDATADLTNKLIGRTVQDIDRHRAADELGFRSKDEALALGQLEDGDFWALGPAFWSLALKAEPERLPAVTRFHVGGVKSRHPTPGARALVAPPAPPPKMRKLLAKLTALHDEADREIAALAAAKVEIARLGRELKAVQRRKPVDNIATPTTKPAPCGHAAQLRALERDLATAKRAIGLASGERDELRDALAAFQAWYENARDALAKMAREIAANVQGMKPPGAVVRRRALPVVPAFGEGGGPPEFLPSPTEWHNAQGDRVNIQGQGARSAARDVPTLDPMGVEGKGITGGAIRMVQQLTRVYPTGLTEPQLSVLAKVKRSGGSFGTYLSRIRTAGLAMREGEFWILTEAAAEKLDVAHQVPQSRDETIALWRGILTGGARRMFEALLEAGPIGLTYA